jgi:hypothetical protein
MPRKHSMPLFLEGVIPPEAYERWLGRKAAAHVKRDRKRAQSDVTPSLYKETIHAAVLLSEGCDAYTGEPLDNNEDAKAGKHKYKSRFALLPTVDHVSAGATEANSRICSWRTNDAKSDLSFEGFVELCQKVLTHVGYSVQKRT